MEIRIFAERVVRSVHLQDKLARPDGPFTDESPGDGLAVDRPERPANLQFAGRRMAPAMPKGRAFRDRRKRAIAHHIFANHELQALEVMADVALRFPEAPAGFRMGLAEIMLDEQRHTQMHIQRAAALGLNFGDLPVNSYIWEKSRSLNSVLRRLSR